MEFRFDLKPIFSQPIARVGANLLPHSFRGDRRATLDTSTKMQEILNTVGESSAKAQGLTKAVTTAQKLRQSENQKIYLLVDVDDGKRGSVIGMLKVGKKSLYVFDQSGTTQMVEAPCILDFYIHESRQRAGLGKDLFETMLQDEQWDPRKLAIDRPSDKLLGFLKKHYNLEKTIPQMNNFVIFDGFFDHAENGNVINNNNYNNQDIKITSSPNTALFGPLITSDDRLRRSRAESITSHNNPLNHGIQNNPIGRYAATRPTCSMAEFNNMTKSATTRPFFEKRSGLQDVDNGTYYQMYGNRTNGYPQIQNQMDPQLIQQHQSQMQPEIQQQNIVAHQQGQQQQMNQNQILSQQIPSQQQILQHQTLQQQIPQQQIPQQQIIQQQMPSQILYQQVPQHQIQSSQILHQQVPQHQVPSSQILHQQIPQHQIQSSQLDIQDNHACCHHENPTEQQVQNQAIQQQQQQQMPTHCQMNNQQLVQQPQISQAVNNNVDIIHSTAAKKSTGEPNSYAPSNDDQHSHVTVDDIDAVRADFEQLETSDLVTEPDDNPEPEEPEADAEHESELHDDNASETGTINDPTPSVHSDAAGTHSSQMDSAKRHSLVNDRYRGNKQHTGMKNMSFGVGAAVTPTAKMEFYQEQPADFGVVKLNQPPGKSFHSNDDNASVISSVTSGDGFTGQGYYDLKFHHNKLW